jgi:hypothetical protein
VLDVDLPNQQVLSTDQLRLRGRRLCPLPRGRSAAHGGDRRQRGTRARPASPLLGSSLRNELGKRPFATLLSPERGEVMENIQNALQRLAANMASQIVDVRIKQCRPAERQSPLDSALNRMATARQQEAATIRAQGLKEAQIIRATAQAKAAQVYAQAFNKDPGFYDFYRAMQSYRYDLPRPGEGKGDTSIVLSPNRTAICASSWGNDDPATSFIFNQRSAFGRDNRARNLAHPLRGIRIRALRLRSYHCPCPERRRRRDDPEPTAGAQTAQNEPGAIQASRRAPARR